MKTNFIGLEKLNNKEIEQLNELTKKFSERISRDYPNAKLDIHIKTQNTDGNRKQYKLNIKLEDTRFKNGFLLVDHGRQYDWDLLVILHKTFQKLENLIEHKIKPKEKETKLKFKE